MAHVYPRKYSSKSSQSFLEIYYPHHSFTHYRVQGKDSSLEIDSQTLSLLHVKPEQHDSASLPLHRPPAPAHATTACVGGEVGCGVKTGCVGAEVGCGVKTGCVGAEVGCPVTTAWVGAEVG